MTDLRKVSAIFVAALSFLSLRAHAGSRAAPVRPPNVVLILADDLGYSDVSFNGRKEWRTPNIDRLAAQGTIFRRWYTAAVVCAPSRAALLTGKYTIHDGVSANNDDLPSDEVTIAEALKPLGYATGLFGKWHHGRPRGGRKNYVHPMDQGFDEFFGYTDARDAWQKYPKHLWFGREERPVQGYADTLFTDHALEFIRRHREQPFFLYQAYVNPHLIVAAPPEDVAEHRGKFPEKDPAHPVRATYAAMVTRLDKEVGRLTAALDEWGLADNTLVIFSSDHGATFEIGNEGASAFLDSNHPFRGQKRTIWEGGIRVPSLVRWPGKVPAGKICSEIVHNIDVLPTVLAAAASEPRKPWHVDGANLLPVWLGQARSPERTLFWEWRSEGRHQLAAMSGDVKLAIAGQDPPELFNVEADPAERRNVIAEYPELAKQLEKELRDWLKTETRRE